MKMICAKDYDKLFEGRDILGDYKVIAKEALGLVHDAPYNEDPQEVYYWMAIAAERGSGEAWGKLGDAFAGIGYVDVDAFGSSDDDSDMLFKIDFRVSVVFYLMGGDENDPCSLEALYQVFQGKFEDIPRDFERAFKYLMKLQQANIRDIELNPAHARWAICHRGEYLLKDLVDHALGLDKFEDWEDAYVLGVCYENGWILQKDMTKAVEYYQIALSLGYKKAANFLKNC